MRTIQNWVFFLQGVYQLFISIISGFVTFLRQVYLVSMPLNPYWNCKVVNNIGYSTSLCSTLLILSMAASSDLIRQHHLIRLKELKSVLFVLWYLVLCTISLSFSLLLMMAWGAPMPRYPMLKCIIGCLLQ